jgi:hypothetical protein
MGALGSDTLGSKSVAIGQAALESQNFTTATDSNNVAVGNNAGGAVTTGTGNTLIGSQAGDSLTSGINSTFVGFLAGSTVSTGTNNTFVGQGAGAATTGSYNNFFGAGDGTAAGNLLTTGSKNTILGGYNGNQDSLDIRASDNNIVLSDGDGVPRLLINDNGDVTNNAGNLDSHSNQNIGFNFRKASGACFSAGSVTPVVVNRVTDDGRLIDLLQADSLEGNISVSGSTVSYNGFSGTHESSGVPTNTAIGTVVSTIDELDTYVSGTKSGQTRADHAKIKVSDTEGDKRIYGVVSGYTEEDDKPLVASVGIGAVKVTGACAGGDLLESNGDGTAKVQSDDIIRSKTLGKVTIANSNTGVKLVSCVLYCG